MLRKLFRAAKSKKTMFVAGLMAAAITLGIGTFGAAQATAAYCGDDDGNAVIYCGFDKNRPGDYINLLKNNQSNPGNLGGVTNHRDIKAIAKEAGLDENEYQYFIDNAVQGSVDINGDIWVGGKKVATNTRTFGRFFDWHSGPGYEAWKIDGTNTTLHGNYPKRSFGPKTTSIPVLAVFDDGNHGNPVGSLMFAVETPCGNVMKYNKVVPVYQCNELHADYVSDGKYNFWTDTTAYGNASIAKVVYDFGNGDTQEVTNPGSNGKYGTTYTYKKADTYTATVTVYVNVPGKGDPIKIKPAGGCIKVIKVPAVECVALNVVYLEKDKTKLKVSFTATANYSGDGVEFKSADFYFGDDGNNIGKKGVLPNADKKTVTAEHTYTFPEDTKDTIKYNTKAVLHFTVNGNPVTADACPKTVTYEVAITECKPGIPEGDLRCQPCPYDSSLTLADKDKCHPPELPNTGAGNTIAIFSAVVIGGFLVYRQLLFRKHRAAFNAAQDGTSPLPLGDPLSDRPLDGTPLETQVHRSFRRKRHF